MKREVHRVVRTLLAAAVLLGASFGLAALETGEAFAYSYRTCLLYTSPSPRDS